MASQTAQERGSVLGLGGPGSVWARLPRRQARGVPSLTQHLVPGAVLGAGTAVPETGKAPAPRRRHRVGEKGSKGSR